MPKSRPFSLPKYRRPRNLPNAICLHEAAHAVIAHCLGMKVLALWFKDGPLEKQKGFCKIGFGVSAKKLDPIVDCCFTMAGHVAEVIWWDRDIHKWPEEDLRQIRSRNITWRGHNTLFPIVAQWLREERPFVFAVARALEERKILTRRQYLNVLRKTANGKAPRK